MGLDVYLRKFDDYEASMLRQKEYEEASEQAWEGLDYNTATDAEKDAARAKVDAEAKRLGLGEWGDDPTEHKVENDSAKYPDHMFKVGYWRSSYNEGGINRILSNAIGKDLYYIAFGGREQEPPEYHMNLDWAACKVRVQEVRAEFAEWVRKYGVRVTKEGGNVFMGTDHLPKSEEAALEVFKAQADRDADSRAGCEAYSNRDGVFYMGKPLPVVAVIPGIDSFGGRECSYIVYRPEDNDWYEQALEIVEECFDFVMAQPDADHYRMSWSG